MKKYITIFKKTYKNIFLLKKIKNMVSEFHIKILDKNPIVICKQTNNDWFKRELRQKKVIFF